MGQTVATATTIQSCGVPIIYPNPAGWLAIYAGLKLRENKV